MRPSAPRSIDEPKCLRVDRFLLGLALSFVLLVCPVRVHAQESTSYAVSVAAGDLDRQNTVVSFPLPANLPAGDYHLIDPSGASVPLQVGSNRAWFVLDRLEAGEQRRYHLEQTPDSPEGVEVERQNRSLSLTIEEAPVLRYWIDERPPPRPEMDSIYLRGGYLHPVRTPSGRVISGDYSPNHAHHHGIWSAWTNTQFRGRQPDFWNMHQNTGAVRPMALDSTWNGPVQGGFRARHRYVDTSAPEPTTALYEEWTLRAYDISSEETEFSYRLFDLTVVQTTASSSPLILPQYHYGGVAVRGPESWYGGPNAHFLTSQGRDRSNGNETRARWTYMGGDVDGERAGIAMLSHPTNVRSPQPVRIHPEMQYFCYAPSQLGRLSIRPGAPYVARYRFVAFDGPPNPEALNSIWRDYAFPPTVTVTEASATDR